MNKNKVNINEDLKKELDNIVDMALSQEETREDGLTNADVEILTERFLGMSYAEKALFLDLIPVEMCMDRIHRELERAKKFKESIGSVMSGFGN